MDTFIPFLTLPSELRIKIWKFGFPEPRVVPVRFNRASQQYTSTTAPPALAHACSQSRSIFLETYTKLVLSPRYTSTVFVDFARDTLFFDNLDCSPDGDLSYDLALSPHADQILNLAVDAQLWEVLRVFKYDSLSEVKLMRNLRTVALVMSKDYDRGLQRRMDDDGTQSLFIDVDANTVGSEIRHVHWYVESLRWEMKNRQEEYWDGNTPVIQMWLL
ncbi:hypothetical protein ONS95_004204 [Cadophora gregata]|uniref:uncharacterized protein n=1 Tax=Cadophora gregata TaxID=51156 RepID=UPI0026DD9C52|nr:uncharacterized protein ONS95_004204 [Cadophora gregata]KAK0105427.1 hypothetical protein ONS96_004815 [Cadophora gregata f. sp. sojae]KAK0105677.1 hypothetical protein ONS95_004204 [Cadophora gregata]